MGRPSMRFLPSTFAFAIALLAAAPRARAGGPTSELATEAELKDALTELDAKGSRPLSLELNPFVGVVATGVSGNVEYVPVRHVGLVASPRASLLMPAWVGEVGARYWTGSKREASGFFVGPSMVYGKTRGEPLYGVALDCGVQTILAMG